MSFGEVPVDFILADDDAGHADLFIDHLRSANFRGLVQRAADGETACRLVNQSIATGHPFMLLLDLNMPGLSGFDVLERIKSSPATRRAPIVVFTSSERPSDIERCYDLGCNLYFTKPVVVSDFLRLIQLIVELADRARMPISDAVASCPTMLYRS